MDFLRNVLLVVGIDFGIIFFGYVFVMRVDFENDFLSIYVFSWFFLS